MKRINKFYDAQAIVMNAQSRLSALNSIKLDKAARELLGADIKAAYDALERASRKLDDLIDQEKGGLK